MCALPISWKGKPDIHLPAIRVSPSESTIREIIDAFVQDSYATYKGNKINGTFGSITGDGLDQLDTDSRGQTFNFTTTFTPEASDAFESVSCSSSVTIINDDIIDENIVEE